MEADLVTLAWGEILKLALTTGIFTAALNQGIGYLRDTVADRRTVKRDGTYLAVRLAVILEAFAIACADQIALHQMHRQSEGFAGRSFGKLPALSRYPDKADWKALDPTLLARTLSLPNELALADGKIAFWADVDPECIPQECDAQAGKCGYVAWSLAVDLRRRYRLEKFDPSKSAWDVVKTLRQQHERAMTLLASDKEET